MTGPRNEHEDYAAYEASGLDGVMGIPRQRALDLANVLSIQASRMDQRAPATAVVKRDVARIYELLHPEPEPATPQHRGQERKVIGDLQQHPAYWDAKHPEHASIAARVARAYEVVHRGQGGA